MLLVADDLYSVAGFGDSEILRGPQAENWRVPLEVVQHACYCLPLTNGVPLILNGSFLRVILWDLFQNRLNKLGLWNKLDSILQSHSNDIGNIKDETILYQFCLFTTVFSVREHRKQS
ncbi:hypothetical protein evm_011667 [Chilo suppressalis]|nr:hypothetical protein evm_011667 [Chilo suppressalis]